jgi:hypothetical protein
VSNQVTPFEGTFEGTWTLSCQSHLPGHDAWKYGGTFCENLTF